MNYKFKLALGVQRKILLTLFALVGIIYHGFAQSCITPGVFPSPPTVSGVTTSALTVTWNSVSSASAYRIFYSLNSGAYQKHSELGSSFNAQNFSSLNPGDNYSFFIEAVRYCVDGEGNPDERTRQSGTVSVYMKPLSPALNEAGCVSANPTTINFLWNASNGAGYYFDLSTSSTFSSYLEQNTPITPSSVTSAIRSSLTPGTNYYYQVRAFNATGGVSDYSPRSTAITTLPAVPTANAATAIGVSSFTASWQSTNGNATSFKIDVSTSPSFADFVPGYNNLTVNGTSQLIDGLTSGSQYFYRVRAFTASATSANSSSIQVKTIPIAKAPSNVLTATFTANWDAGIGATGYQLDVSASNTFSTFLSGYNSLAISGAATSSASVINLTPGSVYYYRVRSVNGLGASTNSNTIMVIATPASKPATNVTTTSMTVNWDGGEGVTNYRLDMSTDNFSSFLPDYNDRIVEGTSLIITGLVAGTTYYYRIRSFNAGVSSSNSEVISQLTLPDTPQDFKTSDNQPSTIKVSWSPVLSVTEYQLEVSATADFAAMIAPYNPKTVTSGTTNLIVTGLEPSTIYYFRIKAKNNMGTSAYSTIQTAITLPSDGKVREIVLGNPQYPEVFIEGQQEISMTVDGGNGTLLVNFYHRKNTEPIFTKESVNLAGGVYRVMLDKRWFDSFGMQFYFEASDLAGQFKEGDVRMIVSGVAEVTTAVSSFGKDLSNYQIISIPYALDRTLVRDVFERVMGTYDKKKWRFSQYQNGRVIDYDEGIGASSLEQGKGYWFISRNEADLSFGQGKSFGNSLASPFKLQLKKGWNQIGNPFPYDLNWQDVLTANNNPVVVSNLVVFDNASVSFIESDRLAVFGGGFVFADEAIELNFPVTLRAKTNGRVSAKNFLPELEHPLDWYLPMKVKQGEITNAMSGIGMIADANEGKDSYDRNSPPRFIRFVEFNSNAKNYSPELARNISNHRDSKVWNCQVNSNSSEPVELLWNNELVKNLGANLILVDETRQQVVNMAQVDSYVTTPAAKVSIYFTHEPLSFKAASIVLGEAYPNPFVRDVSIPFDFSVGGPSHVTLKIIDLTGEVLANREIMESESGLKSIQWNGQSDDGAEVKSGMYLYQVSCSKSGGKSFNFTGKLIKQ